MRWTRSVYDTATNINQIRKLQKDLRILNQLYWVRL